MADEKVESRLALFAQTYSADLLVNQPTLTLDDLAHQNQAYAGTGGTSQGNQGQGFSPAYMDAETGQIVLSTFTDGRPAPIHLLCGLPEEWMQDHASSSEMPKLKGSIVVGFVRDGQFYTRAEAAKVCAH